jgi:glutaminyl-tRNA synthetase
VRPNFNQFNFLLSMSHEPLSTAPLAPLHFLQQIIEDDLARGTYAGRHFGQGPGGGAHHALGPVDAAAIRTRFPPEPNGHLHLGHVKSICLNFGLAKQYGGACHLRFDDTNPEKENQMYALAIIEAVRWLGFDWGPHLYQASDYFDFMYGAAHALIKAGLAYVDEQTPEQIKAGRGDFHTPGVSSPFRNRSVEDNAARFTQMREGLHPDGSMVLRACIDMQSPNLNLRDPAIYRIRHVAHHHTGTKWCIYPMYTFAHPIEDALENITHSICTLEFEDQRPFYDWLLEHLCQLGLLASPVPRQYEFARLNMTYMVTSKRKLKTLVDEAHVEGWDDPRLPTVMGLRRRGYTPESLHLLAKRSGVSKSGGWLDYSELEIALRDDLDPKAPRACAVLESLKLKLTNFAELFGSVDHQVVCHAPVHPAQPALGQRQFVLTHEVWIEQGDFLELPTKGYHRLYPGNKVRLKYGYVIECTGCEKDASGQVTAVLATIVQGTQSGTPGADAIKVKGVLTWVSVATALPAEIRLYDRLFTEPQPEANGRDFLTVLNPVSKKTTLGYVESSVAGAAPETRFQFERHGYFVTDKIDHAVNRLVFNRTTTLKDTWAKK